jgi:penicillin G amidase
VLVTLTLVLAATVFWAVRRSFPQYEGELRIAGLTAPVTVYRDAHGVPQLFAEHASDLFRAQGYVHAQERFWEMDFRRHVTSGRLSELFGASQVETDTYLRTLGWRRVAEAEYQLIAAEVRDILTAYAAGVNAWLAENGAGGTGQNGGEPSGRLSLEYTILGLQNGNYRIEPWGPVDSLAWLKAMAWDLRGNMSDEIARAALLGSGLSRTQVEQLYPAYPYSRNRPILDGQTTANGRVFPAPVQDDAYRAVQPMLDGLRAGLSRLPRMVGENGAHLGSNSWALAGSRTTTGKPILANDPHLGPSMPSIWFQMGLRCTCEFNVSGFTFSGVPGVVIGHNDRIAWAFTNLGPDVTDLYLERLDGNRYEVDGQLRDLTVRTEEIKVAGGKPVTLTIRSTGHGPLLTDASEELRKLGGQYAIALRWTALDPGRTANALYELNLARNFTDFRRAAAAFEVPAQNMLYADVDGNIGYQSPGRIPVRGKGDGKWPAPGWDSAYDWRSYIPFEQLPTTYNPVQGYLVTANQAVVGPEYPHLLTDDWSYGYRSQRINDMIGSSSNKLSVADVQKMQFDNRNGMAPALVPVLLNAKLSGLAAKAQALLRNWDFQQPADSAPAAYYNAVWRHLLLRTFDELPADRKPDGSDRWYEVLLPMLGDQASAWWDDRSTPAVESADQTVAAAMNDAAAELRERLGDDPAEWRWGELHRLTARNQSFGESGVAIIEWLFNHGPADTAGGDAIVNATGWNAAEGYEVDWVPSMRMIVDLSNLDGSRWINLTGASGHAFAAHYADQFDRWRTGETLPMRWDQATIRREAAHTLTLRP